MSEEHENPAREYDDIFRGTGKSGQPWSGQPQLPFPAAQQWSQGPPPPQGPPRKPRRGAAAILIGIALVFVLGVAGIVLAGNPGINPPQGQPQPTAHRTTAPAVATTPTPAAAPSPDGRYSGSCDYQIGYPKADRFLGEVDLHNTGNVATKVVAKIGWPQYGSGYLYRTKTVTTQPGTRTTVRFNFPVYGDQLTLMQDWQEHHNFPYGNGCKIKATIVHFDSGVSS